MIRGHLPLISHILVDIQYAPLMADIKHFRDWPKVDLRSEVRNSKTQLKTHLLIWIKGLVKFTLLNDFGFCKLDQIHCGISEAKSWCAP